MKPPRPPALALPRLARLALRRPHLFAAELHQRWGQVVEFGYGRAQQTYLFGPEANRFVLSSGPPSFAWSAAFRFLEPLDGPTALILSDGDDHRRRRRAVQPKFSRRSVGDLGTVIVEEIDREIDPLRPGDRVDLFQLARRVSRRIVTRAVAGDHVAGAFSNSWGPLDDALRFIERPEPLQLLLLPAARRVRRTRRAADAVIDEEIERRTLRPNQVSDVLDDLLASDLTKVEVRDQCVSLIAAGYHTTSAAIAWTMLELLRSAPDETRTRAELDAVIGSGSPAESPDLRGSLPQLWAAVHEAIRLWPPATLSGRQVAQPVEFEGYGLAPGTIVMFSPYVTHRMPENWGEDAAAFRPSRWFDADPQPFTYIPFGGSYRRCIGENLAITETALVTARLLQRLRLSLIEPGHGATGTVALRPERGVPVIVSDLAC